MSARERAAPGSAPTIAPPEAGALPWVRLITGLMALAILAMPAGRQVPEWNVRPIPDRVITAAALPPRGTPTLAPPEAEDALLASALTPARTPLPAARGRPAFPSAQPKQLGTKATQRRWPRLASARHAAAASTRATRAGRGLTRAQVVREYLVSREQVAALTREDSGSAFLMRVATRHRKPGRLPVAAPQPHGSSDAYSSRMTR